jgi:hypothetical protein
LRFKSAYRAKRSGKLDGRKSRIAKAARVILADTESKEGSGQVANALTSAKEFKEENYEVNVVFDGAATKWFGDLFYLDFRYNGHFESVKDEIGGACAYCARAFGVKEEVQESDVELIGEFEGHPSLTKLVSEGYQMITF